MPKAGGILPDLACRLKSAAEGAAAEVADYDCEYDGHDGCGLCVHGFVSAWWGEDFMERPRKVEPDRKSTLLVQWLLQLTTRTFSNTADASLPRGTPVELEVIFEVAG